MCASFNASDITPQKLIEFTQIDYSRPGVEVIFNNKEFTDPYKYLVRHGSEQDVFSLCTLFRGLNYVVRPQYIDQNRSQNEKGHRCICLA